MSEHFHTVSLTDDVILCICHERLSCNSERAEILEDCLSVCYIGQLLLERLH